MKVLKNKPIEKYIQKENKILHKCVDLINQRISLPDWPNNIRTIFLLALQVKGEGQEAYKAHRTSRHLRFQIQSSEYNVPENPTSIQQRCAERIRADLPRFVKLGAGSYLGSWLLVLGAGFLVAL